MQEDDEISAGSGASREERRRDLSRVLALTDGVLAIIITLLMLDIHVPELGPQSSCSTAMWDVRPCLILFRARLHRGGDAVGWPPGPVRADQICRPRHCLAQSADPCFAVCLLPFGSVTVSRRWEDPVALRLSGLILMGTSITRTAISACLTRRPSLIHRAAGPRVDPVGAGPV